MSEYIKREDLIQKLMEEMCDFPDSMKRELAEKSVADMESIEVVRCKDCIWKSVCDQCVSKLGVMYHVDYCSYGEKKNRPAAEKKWETKLP